MRRAYLACFLLFATFAGLLSLGPPARSESSGDRARVALALAQAAQRVKSAPSLGTPAREAASEAAKRCPCSERCTCGCNRGEVCRCITIPRATPAVQPAACRDGR